MAALNQSTAPNTAEYGGDEVSALVLDPGYSTTRAGFAGEDVPKSVVPTYYGVLTSDSGSQLRFGENAIHNPTPNIDIRNPISSDGLVEDWDVAAKLWEYSITSRLTGARPTNPAKNGLNEPADGDMDVDMEEAEEAEKPMVDSPLLMSEPNWNPTKAREKYIEVAMEDWGCPAFWLGKTGVLEAFSCGKSSALVIDIGAATTSVACVVDGLIMKKTVVRSPLAGNFVSQQIRLSFSQSQPPVPLIPHYMVQSKTPVDAGAPSQAIYKKFDKPSAASFRALEEERVLTEFKESVVQVWDGPGRLNNINASAEEVNKMYPSRPFEMPDGWNQVFGPERFKVVEGFFDADAALTDAEAPRPRPEQTLPKLIAASLNGLGDAQTDHRPNLLQNVVVVGGSSLLVGLTRRLNQEIETMYPGTRVRIFAPGNTVERKYAGWIGGSILASLGSFHQMWVSRKEYEEHGANIVEKRCK